MFYADYFDNEYWDVEYWDSEFPNPSWTEGGGLASGFASEASASASWTEVEEVGATWNND